MKLQIAGENSLISLSMLTRHGIITGATGTGKTVTIQVFAEQLSKAGVPCFIPDIKGDLTGLSQPGSPHKEIDRRIEVLGIDGYSASSFPLQSWSVDGVHTPLRTTVTEFGPLMLAKVLRLSDTQASVLHTLFEIADEKGLLLIDLKDLEALVKSAKSNIEEFEEYGHITKASLGVIQRQLHTVSGAEKFFGEPAAQLEDFMRVQDGRGVINILDSTKLYHDPSLYATILLWLLSEFFEELPEVGEVEKPVFALFLDEAHLLFDDTPDELVSRLEQVVRLIRSKGVAVFLVTQHPSDVPVEISRQLATKVQHALRILSVADQKALKAVVDSFPPTDLDLKQIVPSLETGEAVISSLTLKGRPTGVVRTLIKPPESRIGSVDYVQSKNFFNARFYEDLDRESAYEQLEKSVKKKAAAPEKKVSKKTSKKKDGFWEKELKKAGRSLSRELIRGVLGTIKKQF